MFLSTRALRFYHCSYTRQSNTYYHVVILMFHHQRTHINGSPFQPGAKYCFGCVCKTGEEVFYAKLDVRAHFVFSILLILQTQKVAGSESLSCGSSSSGEATPTCCGSVQTSITVNMIL